MSESPKKISENYEFEAAESPSLSSPTPKPRYGDRFIPTRAGNKWDLSFPLTPSPVASIQLQTQSSKRGNAEPTTPQRKKSRTQLSENSKVSPIYSTLLQNEILGSDLDSSPVKDNLTQYSKNLKASRKLFHYDTAAERTETHSPYFLSPLSQKSLNLLDMVSESGSFRRIEKEPYKILDAPEIQDDFYLNLIDWSAQNVVSVALGTRVYLWKPTAPASTCVSLLVDLEPEIDMATSLAWDERGSQLAIGCGRGVVQIWDTVAEKRIISYDCHTSRIGSLAWVGTDIVFTGSRDKTIVHTDLREPPLIRDRRLMEHRQEVCGLKWSSSNQCLASGGNDNRLCIWNLQQRRPIFNFTDHNAAVKAIAWCPLEHGLLASGGGTADRCIKFWNTLTGQKIRSVSTDSQVCNLAWSKHSKEFVSTHGYTDNQIAVWKYPSLQKLAEFKAHSSRVIYLSMSPDGESIVTGAGDETIRFWNVFGRMRLEKGRKSESSLQLHNRLGF